MKAEDRRAATVDIVVSLAAEGNPSEISTTAIAKKMGVTQGALFKHFPTKDAILQAVIEWVSDKLLARLDKAASTAKSPLAAIEAMFYAHIHFVSEYPGAPRMLFSELQRSKHSVPKKVATTLLQSYSQRLQALLKQGQEHGQIDADLDIAAASTLLIGMIQGLVMQSLLANDIAQIKNEAPRVFTIFRRGIEASHD